MDIQTLKIKRVSSKNLNDYTDLVLGRGEMLAVIDDDDGSNDSLLNSVLYIGDGVQTLRELTRYGIYYVPRVTAEKLIVTEMMHKVPTGVHPHELPREIVDSSATSDTVRGYYAPDFPSASIDDNIFKFALHNHTHKLSREVAESSLDTNGALEEPRCRRVIIGEDIPDNSVSGDTGDIYIRINKGN